MKKVMFSVFLCLCCGCATRMFEEQARIVMFERGYQTSEYRNDVLISEGKPSMTDSQAAAAIYPIKYRLAQIFDYGVIPIGAGFAVYEGVSALNGGGSDDHRVYNYSADHNSRIGSSGNSDDHTDKSQNFVPPPVVAQ